MLRAFQNLNLSRAMPLLTRLLTTSSVTLGFAGSFTENLRVKSLMEVGEKKKNKRACYGRRNVLNFILGVEPHFFIANILR